MPVMMMRLFLLPPLALVLFVTVVVTCASPTPSLRSGHRNKAANHQRQTSARIIGGSIAPPNRYTYYTSLRKVRSDGSTGSHFCGGSLIAPQFVLTAAHCVDDLFYSPHLLHVIIGRPDFTIESDGQVIHVQRVVLHPLFTRINNRAPNYDFALLYLETPVNTTTINTDDEEMMIQLPQLNQYQSLPQSGELLTVIGHGYTNVNSLSISQQLKELDKFALSNEECKNMMTPTTSTGWNNYDSLLRDQMLCADDNPEDDVEEDSCNGDSGGPLVKKGEDESENGGAGDLLVGVVSWGYGCAVRGYPGVYARVSDAYDWIQQEVCNSDNGGAITIDNFGCGTIKVESESEVVQVVVSETPSVSVSPSVTPTETVSSARSSIMPFETQATARPSASPTEIDIILSLPPTLAQDDGGSGFRTFFPTASFPATPTYPPTASFTTTPTYLPTVVPSEEESSAPIPATSEESTVIITSTSTPAPTITPTQDGTVLIFTEVYPIPAPAPAPQFTLFPTRATGTGNEEN